MYLIEKAYVKNFAKEIAKLFGSEYSRLKHEGSVTRLFILPTNHRIDYISIALYSAQWELASSFLNASR